MAGGAYVKIDFRPIANALRRAEKGVKVSTQDPEIRETIYRGIIDSESFIFEKGKDTKATLNSIESLKNGGDGAHGEAYTNDKGITHYAYSSIGPKGILIDPIDEYDRPYGEYSVISYADDFDISDDEYLMDEIIDIITEHIEKGR